MCALPALRLSRRWWGILGLATQRRVAQALVRGAAADLLAGLAEPPPSSDGRERYIKQQRVAATSAPPP